jgi:methionyl-tRNA formyltransferase
LIKPGEVLHPAPKIYKDFCRIDWNKKPKDIYNFIRGLSPHPCAFTYLNTSDDEPVMTRIFKSEYEISPHDTFPGTVSVEKNNTLKVAVEGGYIYIKELQLPGKKRMQTEDFLRGYHGNILSVS